MINGKEYSFQDIQVWFAGRQIGCLQEITYKEKTDRKFIRGNARKASAYADGETEYTGAVGFIQSEMQALIDSVPAGRSVTTLPPFDIVVMYIPDVDNPIIKKHLIKAVLLEEFEFSSKAGDLNQVITLSYQAADIDFKAK
ncbi:hypothetical protein [Rufibacter quisquiliarum]|uniref:Uncharacterized protein n=1 Tax=Rufibacter quisquiliarum TaxID=1549639 RepID=A0A839GJA6_9BACT|nr:hypothetical protein [Rufibacter quisquiliarum]MBA9078942.1 hypothetical protein [Rufibacter quisquiliarum]